MKKLLLASLISSFTCTVLAAPTYNADVPAEIITPNHVESSYLGSLDYSDGAPTDETIEKAGKFVDTSNAVRAFLSGIPIASMQGMLAGHESIGMESNKTVAISEQMLNAESIWLTPNTTTPYITGEIDVKDGPVVIELSSPVLGIIDNAAFKFTDRVGVTHPEDQGKGGKYFVYHTSYEGEVPEGYIGVETEGYQHWLLLRLVSKPGQLETSIAQLKDTMKFYPYAKPSQQTEFINISGEKYNTVHAMNEKFYDELNTLIQYEPTELWDPEFIALAKNIGIEKGKPFAPTPYWNDVYVEASKIATAEIRGATFSPADELMVYDDRNWYTPLVAGHEFKDENGIINIDERAVFHFYATGITPDMVSNTVGQGSAYLIGSRDVNGDLYDGSKHYTVTLPKDVPVAQFWSFMVYDNQTRSMLETDQESAGVDGLKEGLKTNSDGSITIHFSPEAPKGWENNWVQTMPNKGFNLLFRVYGPTEAWFDKTWRLGDLELQD
ncbi:DUF1254 domain-containing protein [uncultured Vibrio sp.]|uniref:DUF1254 domain-containing protein n=1 Tax=uncultured Vibrio sp. TaxID=114054 RepID=UPI0025F1D80A|nr:DUF1214 domain-containing protein [uncultured Vibrio sp.]